MVSAWVAIVVAELFAFWMSQSRLSALHRAANASGSVEIHRLDVVRSGRMMPTLAPFPSTVAPPAVLPEVIELVAPPDVLPPPAVADGDEDEELLPQAASAMTPEAAKTAALSAPLRICHYLSGGRNPLRSAARFVVSDNIYPESDARHIRNGIVNYSRRSRSAATTLSPARRPAARNRRCASASRACRATRRTSSRSGDRHRPGRIRGRCADPRSRRWAS